MILQLGFLIKINTKKKFIF